MRDLSSFCKKLKLKELCIIRNAENEDFVTGLISEIKTRTEWSGSRICVLKGVRRINNFDDRRVIINDFHLLPTSGHAGIRRMTNNIKKFYYWANMDKDIIDFVNRCKQCQTQKQHKN